MLFFFAKFDFWTDDKKMSECYLGRAFFGIREVGFLPYGVQMKGVLEKGWKFDKNVFDREICPNAALRCKNTQSLFYDTEKFNFGQFCSNGPCIAQSL